MDTEVPLFKPDYGTEEQAAVSRVLESGWTGLGPQTKAFEEEFAIRKRVRHAIALNSCTSALQLALMVKGIGPGDEVIVPSLTFCATAHVVTQMGAVPVFCDVLSDNLMIDWDDADTVRTARTKAVIAVNYGGQPRGGPTEFHDIPVIWDFAHAGGMDPIYPFGATGCWSFHSVKNISCGDGGMITTNNDFEADQYRKLRWFGIDKSTFDRIDGKAYSWEYTCRDLGIKAHMNDITAAIGRVQLARLDAMQQRRREVATQYEERLTDRVDKPQYHGDHNFSITHGWHLYPIRVPAPHRTPMVDFLKSKGIQTGVHYKPVHQFHCYRIQRYLPTVSAEWLRLISLPMGSCLTQNDIDRVVDGVERYFT